MAALQALVEGALSRHPELPALFEPGGNRVNYRQLAACSREVAQHIRDLRIPARGRLAICVPKSIASVSCLCGSILAGHPFLPLDPDAPAARNGFIIGDAGAGLVITTPSLAQSLCREHKMVEVAAWTVYGQQLVALQPEIPAQEVGGIPSDLAYILYTSGSTGQPKGVMITHRNATCFAVWAADQFALSPKDVVSSIAPFHFDLSVFDLYASLSRNAAIVLIDPEAVKNPMLLSEIIQRYAITTWYATPTTLKMMLRFGRMDQFDHSSLRTVLFAGEVFPVTPLHQLQERWANARFFNLYGPTETNVCTWHALPILPDNDRTTPYPIGQPCPYARAYIAVDNGWAEPRPGMEGELYIGGESVMAGYLNQPERNAAALVNHGGDIIYATGDIVRVDELGQLEYLRRRDRMVKRNGYRIELGEIESVLHRHPSISEAGVVAEATDGPMQSTLITAFYSTTDKVPLPMLELKELLLQHLPVYMQPDRFEYLSDMPKTSTHKIDYPALAQPAQA
jgi:amino acid adenylation domain-containing protein